jgi:hypothetical protein
MKFSAPNNKYYFEVPDVILRDTIGINSSPNKSSYRCGEAAMVVAMSSIYSENRGIGFRNSDAIRNILNEIENEVNIFPIQVSTTNIPEGYKYRLYHGYHRFHLSLAAGFTEIPVTIQNDEDSDE